MARILYAWELGADYGHLNRFLPLAQRLRARGHQVTLATKDLSRIQTLPGIDGFDIVQAPVWLPQVKGLPEPQMCYPDILLRSGYLDHQGLHGLVRAWRSLYAALTPQLLIADHAPTALLAARGLDMPRVLYGSGFYSPPRRAPLPSMRPWIKAPAQRFLDSEHAALRSINRVLGDLGQAGLEHLAQLFDVAEDFLMVPAEFDHYPNRGPAQYRGALRHHQGGVPADWPAVAGPRVFLYVKPQHKAFGRLFEQLRDTPFAVLAHVPGLPDQRCAALQAANIRVSPQPVDIRAVCREAAVIVCHAGLGTVLEALSAGLPCLLLPLHLEQSLNARNVLRLGAGRAVAAAEREPDFAGLLRELLENPAYAEGARGFARRYGGDGTESILEAVVGRCEELLASG